MRNAAVTIASGALNITDYTCHVEWCKGHIPGISL